MTKTLPFRHLRNAYARRQTAIIASRREKTRQALVRDAIAFRLFVDARGVAFRQIPCRDKALQALVAWNDDRPQVHEAGMIARETAAAHTVRLNPAQAARFIFR